MNVYHTYNNSISRQHLPLPAGWVSKPADSSLVAGCETAVVAPPERGGGGGGGDWKEWVGLYTGTLESPVEQV